MMKFNAVEPPKIFDTRDALLTNIAMADSIKNTIESIKNLYQTQQKNQFARDLFGMNKSEDIQAYINEKGIDNLDARSLSILGSKYNQNLNKEQKDYRNKFYQDVADGTIDNPINPKLNMTNEDANLIQRINSIKENKAKDIALGNYLIKQSGLDIPLDQGTKFSEAAINSANTQDIKNSAKNFNSIFAAKNNLDSYPGLSPQDNARMMKFDLSQKKAAEEAAITKKLLFGNRINTSSLNPPIPFSNIINTESNGVINAINPETGAVGITQVMPNTARDYLGDNVMYKGKPLININTNDGRDTYNDTFLKDVKSNDPEALKLVNIVNNKNIDRLNNTTENDPYFKDLINNKGYDKESVAGVINLTGINGAKRFFNGNASPEVNKQVFDYIGRLNTYKQQENSGSIQNPNNLNNRRSELVNLLTGASPEQQKLIIEQVKSLDTQDFKNQFEQFANIGGSEYAYEKLSNINKSLADSLKNKNYKPIEINLQNYPELNDTSAILDENLSNYQTSLNTEGYADYNNIKSVVNSKKTDDEALKELAPKYGFNKPSEISSDIKETIKNVRDKLSEYPQLKGKRIPAEIILNRVLPDYENGIDDENVFQRVLFDLEQYTKNKSYFKQQESTLKEYNKNVKKAKGLLERIARAKVSGIDTTPYIQEYEDFYQTSVKPYEKQR